MSELHSLLPNHLADLQRSGLSDQTIERWGCYSIKADQKWVMAQLGFGHISPPALALPVLPPDRTEPNLDDVIIKPDTPRLGNNRKKIRYESRARSRNRIHTPLPCRVSLGDPSVPLWVTEGQKKAEKAAQEGLCCIALPGVWNWLSRISSDLSFPLPDFDLIPLRNREVNIVFDSDVSVKPSVRLACRRLAEFLVSRGAHAYRLLLPSGVDGAAAKIGLDDFLCMHSIGDLLALQREPTETEPNLDELLEELSPESDAEQIARVLKLVAQMESAVEREQITKDIANRIKIRVTVLREQIAELRDPRSHESVSEVVEISDSDREQALQLLRSPALLKEFIADTERLGCVGQVAQKTALKLAATSGRRSENPINITIKGESAAGKNFLVKSVLETEPSEDVLQVTRLTAKSLQYLPQSLKHKIVSIAEVLGAEDADYSIRTMQSEKEIRVLVVEKDDSGRLETRERIVEGPAGFFQTTTKPHLHPENETRNFDLFIDESEEQTARIFAVQNRSYLDPMPEEERTSIPRRWENAARLLEPVPVLIPFAEGIRFPTKPLRVRRDRPRFLALIEASALLHQYQRETIERNGRRYLIAAIEDYAIARELAVGLLESVLSGATPKCKQLVTWAEPKGRFSKKDADGAMGWTRKTTLKYLKEGMDLGCLAMDAEKVQRSTEFWFVRAVEEPAVTLPEPEELLNAPVQDSATADK